MNVIMGVTRRDVSFNYLYVLLLLKYKWSHNGSHLLVIIYLKKKKTYYYLLLFPLIKKLVEFLVNLTNEVVQLVQPILIFLKEKGEGEIGG
jgi:hypothetical protein